LTQRLIVDRWVFRAKNNFDREIGQATTRWSARLTGNWFSRSEYCTSGYKM